jgi:hypothetical protein
MLNRNRSNLKYQPMSEAQLMAVAPSVFATQPYHEMSSKYVFIPTIEVVRKMQSEGFVPVYATQSRTRIEGKQDFTKHMIRFRDIRNGDSPVLRELGALYPELALTNAHDGGSSYLLDAALFRLACLNGLMVEDANISKIKVKHTGTAADAVIEASYQVIEQFPQVLDSVQRLAALRLTAPQQNAFADAALSLRYEENEAPVTPAEILQPKRSSDSDPTIWNTYNVVQEHLLNGGDRTRNTETGRRNRTRAVTGIAENTRLNKALWVLTQKMEELVTATA